MRSSRGSSGPCGVLATDSARPWQGRTSRRSSAAPRNAWVIWGNRSIAVGDGETILGRALDATIRFDVPGVSRRHARIIVEGANVTVEDLGSQNGTYVRGEKISGRATLEDGDELRLGQSPSSSGWSRPTTRRADVTGSVYVSLSGLPRWWRCRSSSSASSRRRRACLSATRRKRIG